MADESISVMEAVKRLRKKGLQVEPTAKKEMKRGADEARSLHRRMIRGERGVAMEETTANAAQQQHMEREHLRNPKASKVSTLKLGAYLYGRFPKAAVRRAQKAMKHFGVKEARGREALGYISLGASKLAAQHTMRSMKKKGLLGLGLTAASLGSSIQEARKK